MGDFKRIFGVTLAAALIFSMLTGIDTAAAKKKKATKEPAKEVDLDGTYHAALGLQTDTFEWVYRFGYYHDEYYGKEEWSKLATGAYGGKDYKALDGVFTDAEIKGNGTYTVTLENGDFLGEKEFSQLQVATDIPDTGAITFSDMTVTIDGREMKTWAEPYIDKDDYAAGNCCLIAINHWRSDLDSMDTNCVPQDTTNKIEITFTVSGFHYDNPDTVAVSSTPDTENVKTNEEGMGTEDEKVEKNSKGTNIAIGMIIVAAIAVIAGITIGVSKKKNR